MRFSKQRLAQVRELGDELGQFDEIPLRALQACSLSEFPVMNYAFFPGGNGLYRGVEVKEFPRIDTLILGSDFGCVSGFVENGTEEQELWTTDERGGPTWRGLRQLFYAAGIDRENCFFTNAWPFLHLPPKNGKDSNDNPPIDIWRRNGEFLRLCIAYFQLTLKVLKPRLIVALGKGPTVFLGDVFPKQLREWSFEPKRRLDDIQWKRDLDELFMRKIRAEDIFDGRDLVCIAIHHTSKSNLHKDNRREEYKGLEGGIRLLGEAMKEAGMARQARR